jgi:transcriptional regulator with XRE-family HTH domain
MKTPGQRGAFGEWLTRARTRRFATQAEALREYERLAGLRITPSQYAQWESGSRVPRADNPKVARLFDFYGSQPEDEQQEDAAALAGVPELVAVMGRAAQALERQAAAVEGLVAMLSGATAVEVRPEAAREVAEAEARLAASRAGELIPPPRARQKAEP